MDRCAAAYAYHKQGYNCAQSVAGAFADLTGTAPEQLMAAMGGFGGGDLLRARPGVTERNPASQRLGVTAHCDNMIVTAVEILEQMLQEEPA